MSSALIFVPNGSTGGSGNSPLAYAPDIYVSPANGNDNNSGTSEAEALRTFAELIRRVGKDYFPQAIDQTVHLLDDCDEGIPFWQITITRGQQWRVLGRFTTQTTGTITTARAQDPATRTPTGVEATWIPANEIGRFFRNLNTGAIGVVIKDEGAGVGRLSNMIDSPMSGSLSLIATSVPNNNADSFETLTATQVTAAWNIYVRGPSHGNVTGIDTYVAFCALDFAGVAANRSDFVGADGPLLFVNCRFSLNPYMSGNYVGMRGCSAVATTVTAILKNLNLRICAGTTLGPATNGQIWTDGNNINYAGDHVIQGCSLRSGAASLTLSELAIFDSPGTGSLDAGLYLDRLAKCTVVSRLWGNANTSYGIRFIRGARMTIEGSVSSTYNLTGTLGDMRMGTATTVCPFDPSIPGYTTAIAITWANLLLSVAAGGFGRSIVDPATGCAIAFGTASVA